MNIPLSNDFKIISVLQRPHGEVAFTNFVIQKRDGQTYKKHRTFCHHNWRALCPSPTKLGTVIEDVHTFLSPVKTWSPATHSFDARGTENLG